MEGGLLGKNVSKKVSQCRKTERGPFGIFQHPFRRKTAKKIEEGPFREKNPKKVSQCREKLKGAPFGLARYGMLRGKPKKNFLVQFAKPDGAIWCNNFL